jgi:hypothetical protein
MLKKMLSILAITSIISGCGLSPIQKQQVAQFATATESVSTSTQEQFKSTRDKVIELERRRLIMRNQEPPKTFDIDGGLSSTGIATQIATLKALQSYGDILNKLATNDQAEAISKAATEFLTQYEAAKKLRDDSFALDEDKKNAALGIINIAGSWFVEKEKKKHLKNIVKSYSPEISNLASLLKNDLTLVGDSICIDESKRRTTDIKTGVIDIYCTSADGLKELSSDVLKKRNYSFEERAFAYDSYALSQQAIHEIVTLSAAGAKTVSKLVKANDQLFKVIESDEYTTDDIKAFAQQVQELHTLTKVLIGK